MLTNDHLTMMT